MRVLRRGRGLALLALAAASGLLGGCGGLLPSPPERQLYRASPSFAFTAALPHAAAQLLVATPSAPAGLDTSRIALSRAPVSLDYFADAEWTDRAPFLVQTALVEGFEQSGAIAAVGPESLGLYADFVLETALREFQAVYDSPAGPPRVVVRLDLKLVRMPDRKIVAQAALGGQSTAASNTVPAIVRAFDAALGQAVERVVGWTLTNPSLSGKRGSLRSRTRFVHPGVGTS